jgi:hypothetical protein
MDTLESASSASASATAKERRLIIHSRLSQPFAPFGKDRLRVQTREKLDGAALLRIAQTYKLLFGFRKVRPYSKYLAQFLLRFPNAAEPFVT